MLLAISTALLAFSAPAASQAGAGPRPSPEALTAVGQAIEAYFEARADHAGVDDARTRVQAALAAAGAKAPGWSALKSSADLGLALELAAQARAEKLKDGNVRVETLHEGAFSLDGLEYALRLPKDYDATKRYPLIVSIPDHDEKAADHLRTHWTSAAVRDAALVISPAMPRELADWTAVAVTGRPGGVSHVLTAVRVAGARFSVDLDRVYLVGRGRGAPAAIAAANNSPQRFAGVVTRAGEPGELGPRNFSNLPVLLISGGAQAQAFEEQAKKLGFEHCTALPAGGEDELWEWAKKNPRRRAPVKVNMVPGEPFPSRVYWMRTASFAFDSTATAELDRATNSVRIAASGVWRVTLYLNDELLDLDKPIRVVCNDVESTYTAQRSLGSALEWLREGLSDTRCVYSARIDVDIVPRPVSARPPPTAEEFAKTRSDLAAAGVDPTKLWELHLVAKTGQREFAAERALAKLLRVEPDHLQARAALGHERVGERWFSSRAALERYSKGQDPAVAPTRGLVKRKTGWVHPEEVALLAKGLTKDSTTGEWLAGEDRERLAKGWARQDLDWIAPDQVESLDLGLWRVDGEWVDLATAEQRRASLGSMWRIPTHEIVLHTTCDRGVALGAIEHMGRALDDLRRVFGVEPLLPLSVALLDEEEQYDRFAFGDVDGRRRATHGGRLYTIHYGYVAESWFPPRDGPRIESGLGVGYWDAYVPNGNLYGVHSARLACGLSYVEALDPSPKAVKAALASGPKAGYYAAYQAEKQLPAWLRYGGAVYAERYFKDATVGEGGDPWWARKWSIDNLKRLGELDSLADIFAFRLDADRRDASRKLLNEAGLIVAFLVDGECAPVRAAHEDFKRALVANRLTPKVLAALTDAIVANEAQLRAFAGL
jgi:poly(3-hydroxybutyrate) depolymerase